MRCPPRPVRAEMLIRADQQNRAAERIAQRRAHMQSFVDRFRASATKARQAQPPCVQFEGYYK